MQSLTVTLINFNFKSQLHCKMRLAVSWCVILIIIITQQHVLKKNELNI